MTILRDVGDAKRGALDYISAIYLRPAYLFHTWPAWLAVIIFFKGPF